MEALYTLNSKPVVSFNLDLKRTVAKGEDWTLPNTTEAWALLWLAFGVHRAASEANATYRVYQEEPR